MNQSIPHKMHLLHSKLEIKHVLHSVLPIWYPFSILHISLIQGLLELVWTAYSEGKLPSSCSKLRKFQNPLKKDKSVGL